MAKEIERKFLVDHRHPEVVALMRTPAMQIEQGYIASTAHAVVRIRRRDDLGFLTIKGATLGISRDEYEYPIPLADAVAMLRDLCETSLSKERRRLPLPDGLVVELDYFPDRDLYLAEVELPRADAAFTRPAWFTEEVSYDPAYFNNNLARPSRPGPRGDRR